MADEIGLDLVEIAPDATPPVCKIMDFGKYKYEIAQKAREARQNQTHIVVKEVRMRPKIESHDYETKRAHIEKFLKGGDKVKITMQFRGREQTRPELGYRLLQKLAQDISEFGFVEFAPKQEGRNMTMVLGPTKRKTEAVAEQKAARKAKAAAVAKEEAGE
jgi:translation initiation factor IF-3